MVVQENRPTYDRTLCNTRDTIVLVIVQLSHTVPMDRCSVVFHVVGYMNDYYAKGLADHSLSLHQVPYHAGWY